MYLGVTCRRVGSALIRVRSHHKNIVLAHKLAPATHRIKDATTLRDMIMAFNSGVYAQFITHTDVLMKSQTVFQVVKETVKFDMHMVKILQDFCREKNAFFSINRIISALGLAKFRFGVKIIIAASDFLTYMESLPTNSIVKICHTLDTKASRALRHASETLLPQCKNFPATPNLKDHWLNLRASLRRKACLFFIGIDYQTHSERRTTILRLLAEKNFAELSLFLNSLPYHELNSKRQK